MTVLSTGLFGAIAWLAHQGTIVQHEKRKQMPVLVTALVVVYALQLGVNVFGTVVAANWPAAAPECAAVAEQRFAILVFSVVWVYLDTAVFATFGYFSMNRNKVKSELSEKDMTEFDVKTLQWAVSCCRSSWVLMDLCLLVAHIIVHISIFIVVSL